MRAAMLPFADELPRRERRLLGGAAALLFGTILVTLIASAFWEATGAGGSQAYGAIRDWAPSLVYVLAAGIVALRAVRVRESRAPWAAIAFGLVLYMAGNLLWSFWYETQAEPPFPSVSDLLWLSLYPLSYLGIVLIAREDRRVTPAGVWLDGIVAGLGMAALGAAIVFGKVLDSATGDAAAVAVNLAYPIGDLLLAALVMGVLALRGWRLNTTWALVGGGFLLLWLADSILLIKIANGSTSLSSVLANVFYMPAVALLAFAAWQRPRAFTAPRLEGLSVLLAPAVFSLGALGLLVYDHFDRLDPLAMLLSVLTLVAALGRAALTFRDVRDIARRRGRR